MMKSSPGRVCEFFLTSREREIGRKVPRYLDINQKDLDINIKPMYVSMATGILLGRL